MGKTFSLFFQLVLGRKSLIFQLLPRLAKAVMKSEMCSIMIVSPLVSVMRDQVEQLKQLGFSAAAIGLGEEYDEDEKAARQGKCELVFGNLKFVTGL